MGTTIEWLAKRSRKFWILFGLIAFYGIFGLANLFLDLSPQKKVIIINEDDSHLFQNISQEQFQKYMPNSDWDNFNFFVINKSNKTLLLKGNVYNRYSYDESTMIPNCITLEINKGLTPIEVDIKYFFEIPPGYIKEVSYRECSGTCCVYSLDFK